ncbi:MAG: superinfection immunity protein [Pseudomonadota bacterium]
MIALAIGLILYFLPSFVAFNRGKRNAAAIFILNLFAGWTFIGWVGALIWSLLHDPEPA